MVSRDFEIYYYKDQHMKKVANHIHDYYEIYFFLEGDVSLEIEKKEYPLQYGDVAVVPPGLEHHAVIHDESVPYKRFVFWITVDYLNRLMEDAREYGYLIQLVQTKGEYIFHHDRIAFNTIQTKVFHLLEEIYSNHFFVSKYHIAHFLRIILECQFISMCRKRGWRHAERQSGIT